MDTTRKARYKVLTEGKYVTVTWHAWGQAASQDGAYPVAVVEKEDGQVIVVDADRLQFVREEDL